MTQKIMCAALATVCAASVSAADLYVSLATGKNKNAGTKEAPSRTSGRPSKRPRRAT